MMSKQTIVYADNVLREYNFGEEHFFSPQRYDAFVEAFNAQQLDKQVDLGQAVSVDRNVIERFHSTEYVDRVIAASATGEGFLDEGDTPAFKGVYEASAYVVGTVLDAVDRVVKGEYKRAFVPIAGLHHAGRENAAGFCVFNDCGVAIETLRDVYGIERIAYIDIDAHHGDGVFYAFERDPNLLFADIHEDGDYLYPGTGFDDETGKADAIGTKLNIGLEPDSDDRDFMKAWKRIEGYIQRAEPEFILFQCGADSLKDDPITHLNYSAKAHAHAASSLVELANKYAQGRLVAVGGGGYKLENVASAWSAVVQSFTEQN